MDYNEILCQAIDTIVAKRISEVSFDKTILCTITDNSKKENGEYTVTDGSISFQAFSESNKYQKGHQVYVQIPMGNYADKKIILGRYSSEGDEMPIAYVSPLDKIVPMSANYAEDLISYGLIANSINQAIPLLNNRGINEDTINYDTLCVKADFKCLLQKYTIKSGNYGLSILLTTEDNQTINIELDCTQDMFGNPYAYTSYFTQSQAYKLNLTSNIKTISAYFYQRANFTYNTGKDIEPQPVPVQDYENIFINNIEIYFAYDASSVVDNTVKINTADGLEYNGISKENLNKTLSLIWYNKDENNKYIGFTDGEFGALEEAKNVEKNVYYIQWEHSLNNGSWEPVAENVLDIEVELNPLWSINEYRAVITFQGNTYTSNILQFVSKTGLENEIKNSLNLRLTLHNGEYSLDSYPLYGADTVLINPLEAHRQRELYFFYESAIGGSLEPDALTGATAYFYIPNNVTMLEQPSDQSRLLNEDKTANWYMEGYTTYAYTFGSSITQKDKTFKYRIKKNYNPLFINNTVLLRIIDENGYEYFTSKSFNFSRFGTSGTDYTIFISDSEGQDCVIEDQFLNLTAQLYDANFEEIVSGEGEEGQIEWEWTSYPTGSSIVPNRAGEDASLSYSVAKASTIVNWVGNNTTISALYPIAYSSSPNYMYQGPTTIVYNSNGILPVYFEGDIRLFDKYTNSPIACNWYIEYYKDGGAKGIQLQTGKEMSKAAQRGIASLTAVDKQFQYPRLKPAPIYLSNNNIYLVLCATDYSQNILWRQPLIFLQNQYSSALLNNWDGKLIVDNANNYILSAMMGAGSKNDENQFTGVLMGDIGKAQGAEGDEPRNDETQFGLFGYHEGAQSFGFNTNGTAFIGKSDQGRIEFNGNGGIIKSAAMDGMTIDINNGIIKSSDQKGMIIDVDNGKITTSQFNLFANSGNFILDSNPSGTAPYFKIQAATDNFISYSQNGLKIQIPNADLLIGDQTVGAQISASKDELRIEIADGDEGVRSEIEQTDTSLRALVASTKSNLQSQINQKPDSIVLSVENGEIGKTASITLTVDGHEGTPGTIDLTGVVTFSDLEDSDKTTVINGNHITTGMIVADYLDVNGIMVKGQATIEEIITNKIEATTIIADELTVSGPNGNTIFMAKPGNNITLGPFTVNATGLIGTHGPISCIYGFTQLKVTGGPTDAQMGIDLDPGSGHGRFKIFDPSISGGGLTFSNLVECSLKNCSSDIDLSDERYKNSIEELQNGYEQFYNSIIPVRYKYNDGTSNRYHTGFIAQQLVSALETSGLTTLDFAGVVLQNADTEEEKWFLRRDEFVALNTWQIQKLKNRLMQLEKQLSFLQQSNNS